MMKPRTRKAIVAFLTDHFRYDTMNSWNAATSYAVCIKIHRLGLTRQQEDACGAMLDVTGCHDLSGFNGILREFDERHGHVWQIGSNGRSGGYLVLYQGGIKPSGYKSYCNTCGQLNYQEATEGNNTCGHCQNERVNFKTPHMQTFTYPGKGLDMGEEFSDWDTSTLKARLELVWDFDQTCNRACAEFLEFAMSHVVEEREVMVPHKVKVAV